MNASSNPDLWQELRDATAMPQVTNLKRLCELLDWAIEQLPEDQKLGAAGKAIEQMAEVYALRFNYLMKIWEAAEDSAQDDLPVLDLEVLETWIRQSMAVNLDALVEQPNFHRKRKKQLPSSSDSVLAVVEPEAVLQMVEQIEAEQRTDLIRQLAGEENPTQWSTAIAQWFQSNPSLQPTPLSNLFLEVPLDRVEIWLGLLLGPFELEQAGELFHSEIFVRSFPCL